jgi:hypothetical protein
VVTEAGQGRIGWRRKNLARRYKVTIRKEEKAGVLLLGRGTIVSNDLLQNSRKRMSVFHHKEMIHVRGE